MSTYRAKQLIRDNLNIPTLPAVVQEISLLVDNPKSGTAEIGALIAQDAPLAAKVLRIAGSAYYGLRERCLSTEQASSVLACACFAMLSRKPQSFNSSTTCNRYPDSRSMSSGATAS